MKKGFRNPCLTRDFITDGHVVMLWKFNQNAMELNGFEMVDHIQAKLPFKSLFRIIQQKRHDKKGLPDIDYEDVCVYRRKQPDVKLPDNPKDGIFIDYEREEDNIIGR